MVSEGDGVMRREGSRFLGGLLVSVLTEFLKKPGVELGDTARQRRKVDIGHALTSLVTVTRTHIDVSHTDICRNRRSYKSQKSWMGRKEQLLQEVKNLTT